MSLEFRALVFSVRGLTGLLCRVDDRALAKIPLEGPMILVCNHINSLEVPLVFSRLTPRQVTGFAKSETWDNPLLGKMFDMWGAIPLKRDYPDIVALRSGLKALEQGKIVAISPEGTRSWDGRLQQGHPGIVTLALRANAPILPLAYYGGEKFSENLRRLRRTDFRIEVGQPFYLNTRGERVNGEIRRKITDEIMFQLAMLLPPKYRGMYADFTAASKKFLRFV